MPVSSVDKPVSDLPRLALVANARTTFVPAEDFLVHVALSIAGVE